ncbi:copper-translocating P-type ATPase [Candidatus Wolfebacteria bacterium RIFCSPLOWO2_01_FULL_45_19]|uniref:Copper-translocating P-type ATPase n=1 Tax=Candidatus Wolfebacteria bacterium RIFCSPLOWO2_01_FULL_45_19 TaxID=1802557 RepID=A0A1F8DQA4_9BACT|nr:MAG: Cation transporting ATPase, E1-E2 family [Parcubacteria group bacterium GW2011_GWB1_45_9]OGM90811.1 MAG: copper-translocating P-type ATPase [Candidatus Wolfebacteria bacterium RIFCSPLOWO2_01_FULL_45_19]
MQYICPMHPEIRQDEPGMCSECGMRLVLDKSRPRSGRGSPISQAKSGHAGHKTESLLRKFWVVFALTIPIVAYSELPEIFLGVTAANFGILNLEYGISLVLGSIVFFYGGWIFLTGAWRELRARLPGMMTLIGLATSAAYLWSVYAVFAGEHPLFWELATLITVMLLGHYLEMRAVQGARGALKELSKLLPDTAEVIGKGMIKLEELKASDIVLVKPGAKVPADGKITEGQSELNESIVTGESKLVSRKPGDEVIAGTINGDGSLKVEVTKIGESTFLAGVMRLVAEAQASKSRLQVLSDKAALILTMIAVTVGGFTLIAWLLAGADTAFAVARLVAVLVIACPHALGLAVPLVASISTNMAASSGFLVKQRLALEAARNIEVVLFDKTGTLTKGEFGVVDMIGGFEVLQLAASVNSHSEHPLARAMVKEAMKRNIELTAVSDFRRIPGKGVRGKIGGEEILVGSPVLLEENKIELGKEVLIQLKKLSKQGKTLNHVIKNKTWLGAIALSDVIREESMEAIKALKSFGIKTAMVTGDSEDVAKWVAGELGINEYFARVMPDEKSEKVKILQRRGVRVAFVGDGVNDAPALMQADLGIAVGAGTNVAIESAGIILVKNDPRDIPRIIKLSRLTYSKMFQNLLWATGYNVVAIPLAAGALAFQGIILQPAVGAVFMSISTVIVAVNAMLMRRKKI